MVSPESVLNSALRIVFLGASALWRYASKQEGKQEAKQASDDDDGEDETSRLELASFESRGACARTESHG